ncbi:hypothetical protein CCP2SC5_630003 [Azospirillaceae bacterium]
MMKHDKKLVQKEKNLIYDLLDKEDCFPRRLVFLKNLNSKRNLYPHPFFSFVGMFRPES